MGLAAHADIVRPDWTDGGGRMTAPGFALAFGAANAAALEALGLGPGYRAATGCAMREAEAKFLFRHLPAAGEAFRVLTWPAGVDERRLSLVHRMIRSDGRIAAESEFLFLNTDLNSPETASIPLVGIPFSPAIRAHLADLAALAQLRSPVA